MVCLQDGGGGGGGGRVAVYTTNSNSFRGHLSSHGGGSNTEAGGPGTVYVSAPNATGTILTYLYIDNDNNEPLSAHVKDPLEDSARAYIVNEFGHGISRYDFDHVSLTGAGHLAFRDTSGRDAPVYIKELHGDRTGFLHSAHNQHISVEDSDSPFPAAFRVYTDNSLSLPTSESCYVCTCFC